MKKIIIISVVALFSASVFAQTKTNFQIGFYNTENLFDTKDDPTKNDEDFLPTGKMKWDDARYNQKLQNIAKVMSAIDPIDCPEIMGFCEIENKFVLEELISKTDLKKQNYAIVHFDSPDERGIDVGLIYKRKLILPVNQKSYRVTLSNAPDVKTRDILVFTGVVKKTKENITVLVNHWPSRRGGDESIERRVDAAKVAKHICDSVLAQTPNAKILLMGDFNDEPTDKSVYETLNAKETTVSDSKLYNMMYAKKMNKEGSHYYKGEYGTLDQIIVSKGFLENKGYFVKQENVMIGKFDFLMFENKKSGEKQPNRTYVGEKFVGGYSDHLPVYVELEK